MCVVYYFHGTACNPCPAASSPPQPLSPCPASPSPAHPTQPPPTRLTPTYLSLLLSGRCICRHRQPVLHSAPRGPAPQLRGCGPSLLRAVKWRAGRGCGPAYIGAVKWRAGSITPILGGRTAGLGLAPRRTQPTAGKGGGGGMAKWVELQMWLRCLWCVWRGYGDRGQMV